MTENTPRASLVYATPSPLTGSPLWAGFWMLVGGLVLILFGGCFCIGIMITTGGGYPNHSSPRFFLAVLYVFAFACFIGGAATTVLGIRKLISVGR